jgi:hypothetical protein
MSEPGTCLFLDLTLGSQEEGEEEKEDTVVDQCTSFSKRKREKDDISIIKDTSSGKRRRALTQISSIDLKVRAEDLTTFAFTLEERKFAGLADDVNEQMLQDVVIINMQKQGWKLSAREYLVVPDCPSAGKGDLLFTKQIHRSGTEYYSVETKMLNRGNRGTKLQKVKEQAYNYALQATVGLEVGSKVNYGIALDEKNTKGEVGDVKLLGTFRRDKSSNTISHIEEGKVVKIDCL